ncbi:MAG: type II toxin-antitoxin system RelE/ParE family toxin [Candidatus Nitrotoga sp.]|nr:type II toxin-antitoxin system RelE/ParE family toxin [Candidatus Nitrotoga sp.]MDP1854630.1 type II toxin-antitoxin system RelE/ParE family toxin [Candidatus Nitrotoga sp.]
MIKAIQWLGDSLENVREFSNSGRYHVGRELRRVQTGEMPTDWKPMITVGPGVAEIRIHAENEYRVIYIAKFEEAVYVLHGFTKKTQQTSKRDIDLAAKRYRELQQERRKK